MPRHPKELDIDALRRDYTGGATAAELAAKHGVSNVAILKRLRSAGVEIRPPKPRSSFDASDEELFAEYEAGASSIEIARKHGVSVAIVTRRLRRVGALRPLARSDLNRSELRAEYESGASLEDLAAKYGASSGTIGRRIRAAGGLIRRRNDNPVGPSAGVTLSPTDLRELKAAFETIRRILERA